MEEIQTFLQDNGYKGLDGNPLEVTGYYDFDTCTAVNFFKLDNHIDDDGMVSVVTNEVYYLMFPEEVSRKERSSYLKQIMRSYRISKLLEEYQNTANQEDAQEDVRDNAIWNDYGEIIGYNPNGEGYTIHGEAGTKIHGGDEKADTPLTFEMSDDDWESILEDRVVQRLATRHKVGFETAQEMYDEDVQNATNKYGTFDSRLLVDRDVGYTNEKNGNKIHERSKTETRGLSGYENQSTRRKVSPLVYRNEPLESKLVNLSESKVSIKLSDVAKRLKYPLKWDGEIGSAIFTVEGKDLYYWPHDGRGTYIDENGSTYVNSRVLIYDLSQGQKVAISDLANRIGATTKWDQSTQTATVDLNNGSLRKLVFKNGLGANSVENGKFYTDPATWFSYLKDVAKKPYVGTDVLKSLGWKNISEDSVVDLNNQLRKYGITSFNGIRHFLSQASVESDQGASLTEKHDETPEATFGYRVGMVGNKTVEDTVKFKGAGYMQLTHLDAYEEFARDMKDPEIFNQGAEYVAKYYPWESAAWFWSVYKESFDLKGKADRGESVEAITKIINGGETHVKERKEFYNNSIFSNYR